MPVVAPKSMARRGSRDARRHREKQKKVIKEQLPHIIAEESIITGKKNRPVKIPIKSLRIPEFKHRHDKGKGGLGQGKGKPGDVIGKKPGSKQGKKGSAGQEPGVDYIETEVEMEELIEMMLEDLGLPRLEEKDVRRLIVEMGWRIHGTAHAGPRVMLNRKKTAREGIRRFWHMLEMLHEKTGCERYTCYLALKETSGNTDSALALLFDASWKAAHPADNATEEDIVPFTILHPQDERYHRLEQKISHRSQAVIFAMMDVSYSMSTEKKYFARSMLFWLVAFLRQIYEHVEIRFIVHHTTARLVPEEEFFATGESGGTFVYAAYELAKTLIDSEYPQSQWNVYAWHFSDGEDFGPDRSVAELRSLFERNINMFGYGEIQPEGSYTGFANLLDAFTEAFHLDEYTEEDNFKVVASAEEKYPFLGVVIETKEHILPALKAFLKRDRWQQ